MAPLIRLFLTCLIALLWPASLFSTTFTVTNTNDSGAGSLRQAILDANNNPGLDTIAFNIPGPGVRTISPTSALPTVTDPVIIDGYTQPGASQNTLAAGDDANLLIELEGSSAGGTSGLRISAGSSTVRGLVINRFVLPSGGDDTLGNGILLEGIGGDQITGNFLGTDAGGTLARPNTNAGVFVSSPNNVVGGTTPEARNVISGNAPFDGVYVSPANGIGDSSGNVIQGNFIGTQADGVSPLGNARIGVTFAHGAHDNVVGGTSASSGNVIAFNVNGVVVGTAGFGFPDSTGISVLGNNIFSNAGLGIDLAGDGVTANDDCDTDTGPNNLQNYPVLTSITATSGNVNIIGTLNGAEGTTFRLEFFGNDAVDPSFFGEGQVFLGFANVTTDASCNAAFDVNFPAVSGAPHITATATDPMGNTSEFSAAIGQLLNISTRLQVLTGDNVLIGGFILTGSDAKKVIVRGIGPSLTSFGVPGALQDPFLELHDINGAIIGTNDNWRDTQESEIEATGLAPTDDRESAIVMTLASDSNYTAILRGTNDTTGVGLVEVYDLDQAANSKLANISTRGFVDTGDNVMIGGFISGNGVAKVIVRAIGPSLTSFGVPGALQDPTLELHDINGAIIATNDNWRDTQESEIEATGLAPTDDRESAIVATITPSNYTAIVRGNNDTTGVALVEVYNIQ